MQTETYCCTLSALDPVKAIRAIHQALIQLSALDSSVDCQHFDNGPALADLRDCMKQAGHMGFTS